jgi:hypothetical protein
MYTSIIVVAAQGFLNGDVIDGFVEIDLGYGIVLGIFIDVVLFDSRNKHLFDLRQDTFG